MERVVAFVLPAQPGIGEFVARRGQRLAELPGANRVAADHLVSAQGRLLGEQQDLHGGTGR
jgi:hypothetical protein